MIILKSIELLEQTLQSAAIADKQIGFVPTMGALHAGHLSLINACKNQTSYCIASIFINPAQFNNPLDFANYPNTLEYDIDVLEKAGCDLLFLPSLSEIYPADDDVMAYDIGEMEHVLEGKFRPGHFQGVCRVVDKLLQIVRPQKLFLGIKDYQQCMVIKRMIEIRQHPVEVITVPTMRETSGLAMSSRNMRLSLEEKQTATIIFTTLQKVKAALNIGNLNSLQERAVSELEAAGFVVDYICIVTTGSLTEINYWNGQSPLTALAAATINNIRLIDNVNLFP